MRPHAPKRMPLQNTRLDVACCRPQHTELKGTLRSISNGGATFSTKVEGSKAWEKESERNEHLRGNEANHSSAQS